MKYFILITLSLAAHAFAFDGRDLLPNENELLKCEGRKSHSGENYNQAYEPGVFVLRKFADNNYRFYVRTNNFNYEFSTRNFKIIHHDAYSVQLAAQYMDWSSPSSKKGMIYLNEDGTGRFTELSSGFTFLHDSAGVLYNCKIILK